MRSTNLALSIAASVDAPAALAPVLGELFAGVGSLGSSPGQVVRLLRGAGVGRGDRVLDMACGKGAIAVAAAETLGCRVIGVDGSGVFVEAGRELRGSAEWRAWSRSWRRMYGGSRLRRWAEAHLRTLGDAGKAEPGGFDAAMMIGLFALVEAARLLRRFTRRGGVYVVDDCFLDPGRGRPPRGLEGVPTLDKCARAIAALGDVVERVEVPSPSAVGRMHWRLRARLTVNAARVGRERPRLRAALREFLRRQRDGERLLVGPVRPAVWVVRRG